MEPDKKLILTLPAYLHKQIKIRSAKTSKSMNLLIVEAVKKSLE